MVLMSLIGGFLLGQVALTGFMILLMAIVPPDEARSLQRISFNKPISHFDIHEHHHRALRSIPEDLIQSVYQSEKSVPNNNENNKPVQNRRNGKFLSNLLRSDPMNCMPQVMCELSSATEPSDSTGTLNDYMYVMNEILKPDDDDYESGKPHTRSSSSKFKGNQKSSNKKRRPIKKNESDEDSSGSPEDVSKPSAEVKVQGRAELMEMEDDDALEEKAIEDLVKEDPRDIAYAMADMKRRDNLKLSVSQGDFKHLESDEESVEFGYLPGFDQMSYERNFNRLEKSVREGRSLRRSSMRNSRAVQESFVERKKRELQQTNNFFDRVRVAAEVGDFTRSARQCRALFDSCSTPQIGLNQAVNTIRKAIVGTPVSGRKKNGLSTDELKRIVSELKSQQPAVPGGTDVKVVLNFGGPQSHDNVFRSQPTPLLATQETSTVQYRPPPPPPTQNPSNQIAKKLEALQSFLKKQKRKSQILKTVPEGTTNLMKTKPLNYGIPTRNKNKKQPMKKLPVVSLNILGDQTSPKVPNNSSSGVFKLDLFPQFEGDYQKTQNISAPRTAKISEMTNTISKLSKIIDSKLRKLENSDESLSLESSEESSPEVFLPSAKKLKRNRLQSSKKSQPKKTITTNKSLSKANSTRTFPKMSPKKVKQPRIATPYPHLQMNEDYSGPESPPYPSFNAIVEKAHSFLFRNRQVAPLPKDPRYYVPSAQRHAFHQHQNSMESAPPMAPRGRRSQQSNPYSPFPDPVYHFPFKFWK